MSTFDERFAAVANTTDDSDWVDVRRRARRANRRAPLLAAAALVLAVAVVAPAFGLQRVVIDFLAVDPAPDRVQVDFSRLGVVAPVPLGPNVIPGSARKIMDVRYRGHDRAVWAAPTREGGFCVLFEELTSACRERTPPTGRRPLEPGELRPYVLGASGLLQGDGIVQLVVGSILEDRVESLTVEFADGSTASVPITWVSQPIDAGFYVYEVPEDRRLPGRQLSRLVARSGPDLIAAESYPLPAPGDVERPARLPDGELVGLPRKALPSKARRVVSIATSTGTTVSIWVVPTSEGGTCFVWARGGGCPPVGWTPETPLLAGLASGSRPILFQAQTQPAVKTIELRYQDGVVQRVVPNEGFALAEVPAVHHERGHRLVAAVALDSGGRVLERQPFDARAFGVYPCEEPVDVGRDVRVCP
jgi:hypothetical protein